MRRVWNKARKQFSVRMVEVNPNLRFYRYVTRVFPLLGGFEVGYEFG
jgi:hypothetical protein